MADNSTAAEQNAILSFRIFLSLKQFSQGIGCPRRRVDEIQSSQWVRIVTSLSSRGAALVLFPGRKTVVVRLPRVNSVTGAAALPHENSGLQETNVITGSNTPTTRYFGSKAGRLETHFDESWARPKACCGIVCWPAA